MNFEHAPQFLYLLGTTIFTESKPLFAKIIKTVVVEHGLPLNILHKFP